MKTTNLIQTATVNNHDSLIDSIKMINLSHQNVTYQEEEIILIKLDVLHPSHHQRSVPITFFFYNLRTQINMSMHFKQVIKYINIL